MMRKNRCIKIFSILLLSIFIGLSSFSDSAVADGWYEKESGYYTMLDDAGETLTLMARELFVEDEYITSDNNHYRISKVDKKRRTATATHIGEVELPHIEEIKDSAAFAADLETVSIPDEGSIILYCTHSAESYIPGDGAPSIEGGGGILDIAESFKENLESHGVNVTLDKTPHEPHDAGAYRRSRNTAMQLINSEPAVAAIFDIHRDATPKEEYDLELAGEPATKVRIVIGRQNQNMEVNQELAYKIKAVADKTYPGLIKDIYIGKGMYNQELSPRSLLFEMGTHESEKDAVETSTKYLADVVTTSLFGGKIKSVEEPHRQYKAKPIKYEEKETKSPGKGMLWLAAVFIVGIIAFMLISNSTNELKAKFAGDKRDDSR